MCEEKIASSLSLNFRFGGSLARSEKPETVVPCHGDRRFSSQRKLRRLQTD